MARRYYVAFMDREETTALLGTPKPVPPGVIQFNASPTDAGSRGWLGQAGGGRVRFRVRTMHGGGVYSPWSVWKLTSSADCAVLGFQC